MVARLTTSRRSSTGGGVTLVELLIVASIIATVTGMTWSVHNRQRRMLAREKAIESQIPERRERIEGYIDKATEAVEFRLVSETADGKPVAGVPVRIRVEGDYSVPPYLRESNAEGRVRFDRVPFGNYVVSLHPAKNFWAKMDLSLAVDKPIDRTIVVPVQDQISVVAVKVHWPQDIEARTPQLIFGVDNFQLVSPHSESEAPITWNVYEEFHREQSTSFWVNDSGDLLSRPRTIGILDSSGGYTGGLSYLSRLTLGDERILHPLSTRTKYEPTSTLAWPGKDYRVANVAVVVGLSRSRAKPEVGEQVILIWNDSADWDHRFVAGSDGTTLELTPTEKSLDLIRKGFVAIDEIRGTAAGNQSTSLDEPKVRTGTGSPADSAISDENTPAVP